MTKVAVVTGGASGIGRATAERFLDAGWAVVVADLNASKGEELAREHTGARTSFVATDVSSENDVRDVIGPAQPPQDDG